MEGVFFSIEITWGCAIGVDFLIARFIFLMFTFFWVHMLKLYMIGFLTGCTCWSSSGYASVIGTLRGSAWLIGRFSMMGWFYSLCTTLRCFSGEVTFKKSRYLNASLYAFLCVTSGFEGSGFCSA